MNKTKIAKMALVALIGAACVNNAQAVIIDHGSYLTDTESGLDWLDVTETLGLSYNSVTVLINNNAAYQGWRYATGDEFNALVSNYTGIHNSGYSAVNYSSNVIDGLIVLFGSTVDLYASQQGYGSTAEAWLGLPDDTYNLTQGIIEDWRDATGSERWVADLWDIDLTMPPHPTHYSIAHEYSVNVNYQWRAYGSYLVRNTAKVPEPSTIAILAIGLVGLVVSRIRGFSRTV